MCVCNGGVDPITIHKWFNEISLGLHDEPQSSDNIKKA